MGSKAKKISIFAVQRGILPYTLFGILPSMLVFFVSNQPQSDMLLMRFFSLCFITEQLVWLKQMEELLYGGVHNGRLK